MQSFTTALKIVAKAFASPNVVGGVKPFAVVRPVCQERVTRTTMASREAFLERKVGARSPAFVGTSSSGPFAFPTSS